MTCVSVCAQPLATCPCMCVCIYVSQLCAWSVSCVCVGRKECGCKVMCQCALCVHMSLRVYECAVTRAYESTCHMCCLVAHVSMWVYCVLLYCVFEDSNLSFHKHVVFFNKKKLKKYKSDLCIVYCVLCIVCIVCIVYFVYCVYCVYCVLCIVCCVLCIVYLKIVNYHSINMV